MRLVSHFFVLLHFAFNNLFLLTFLQESNKNLDESTEFAKELQKFGCPADLGGKCSDSDDWEGDFFPDIPKIKYEGPSSKNPLAHRWYNAEEEFLGKKMKDWFRFSVAFWHTFRGTGGDPFSAATKYWPWEDGTNSLAMAKRGMRAIFEFLKKLGVDWWSFHVIDIAPDGSTLEGSKIRPLCGTAQLFLHPRYMHAGAMEVTERECYSAATERDRYGKSVDTTSRSLKMVTSGILNRANSGFSTYTVSRRLFSGVANGNESREGTSVYWKVSSIDEVGGTVADILDREEGLSKPDLVRWADLLDKKGKTQQALEIFEWMQRKKMTFSPSDNVTFVDLLAKTKGVRAAHDFVDGLPPKKENLPATFKLLEYYGRFVHEQWKDSPWSYTPQVEPVKKVHQHRNAKLYGNGTRGNILLQSMNE